jgi:hypothetical protein
MALADISFITNRQESKVIGEIVERAVSMRLGNPMDIRMDITATHANGNPLRLADLRDADEVNFLHDVCGISRHLDRDTGKLMNSFSPRYSDRSRRV